MAGKKQRADPVSTRMTLAGASVRVSLLVMLALFISSNASGGEDAFILPTGREVFGEPQEHVVRDKLETLIDLTLQHDLGYNEITAANPELDPWYPGPGRKVIVPTSWILPAFDQCEFKGGKSCIVINLAEYRLYRITKQAAGFSVRTHPIGVGREGYETETGRYHIIEKLVKPAWKLPPSARADYPDYPAVIPAGPDNPLGEFALRLSKPDYLIHGTVLPLGVGRRVSRGCIRMYPEDIERLFREAAVGETVVITYQPVKIGLRNGYFYLEAHEDYLGSGNLAQAVLNLLSGKGVLDRIDVNNLNRLIAESRGLPVPLVSQ